MLGRVYGSYLQPGMSWMKVTQIKPVGSFFSIWSFRSALCVLCPVVMVACNAWLLPWAGQTFRTCSSCHHKCFIFWTSAFGYFNLLSDRMLQVSLQVFGYNCNHPFRGEPGTMTGLLKWIACWAQANCCSRTWRTQAALEQIDREDGLVAAPVQTGAALAAAPAAHLSTGQVATSPDSPLGIWGFIVLTMCNEWFAWKICHAFHWLAGAEFERHYCLNSWCMQMIVEQCYLLL